MVIKTLKKKIEKEVKEAKKPVVNEKKQVRLVNVGGGQKVEVVIPVG